MKSNKIKILYIANDLTIGGAEETYLILAKYLNKSKFDICFLVIGEQGQLGKEIRKYSKTIFLNIPGRPLNIINKIRAIKKILKVCSDFKPDILHSQLWTSNTLGRIAGMIMKTKTVITEQNVYTNRNKFRLFIDHILSYTTERIIAVSEPVREFIVERQKINPIKVKVINNSFDQIKFSQIQKSYRKELGISRDIPVMVSIGMLGRFKNNEIILDALSKVKPNYLFLFVGNGPKRKDLESLSIALKINKNIKFLGWRRDISNILTASDIYILSSYTEGLSLSLMEAMFMKKVCIVSDIKPNRVLINKKNGFLFSPDKPEELAKKIIFVLNNKNLWKQYGESAKATISKDFAMQKMIKGYEKLYEDVIKT